jgi:predicted ATPase
MARCGIFAFWQFFAIPTRHPLICIEEPELGLHPDILPKLGDLLRAASQRTQIIVTTHSDILVDTMTETSRCGGRLYQERRDRRSWND